MEAYDKYLELKDQLGEEKLLEELVQAMGTDELESNLDYIARMYDISFDEDLDESLEGTKNIIKDWVSKVVVR